MFLAQKESGWNIESTAMKNATAISFKFGEESMRHIQLLLAKGGFLLKGEVGWVRTDFGGVWRKEMLGQSLDLR